MARRAGAAAAGVNYADDALSGVSFAPPPKPVQEKPKPAKRPKLRNDPKHVAAARELRDRRLEQVNADASPVISKGKYDVSRGLADARPATTITPLLPAPIAA